MNIYAESASTEYQGIPALEIEGISVRHLWRTGCPAGCADIADAVCADARESSFDRTSERAPGPAAVRLPCGVLGNARCHLRTTGRASGPGSGFAAGEIANVTQAFHPAGRFSAANSP